MSDTCCQTTEDGSAICLTSPSGTCQSASSETLIAPAIIPTRPSSLNTPRWKSVIAFGIACITSPCCTPLIVPVMLALLVGTPAAVWISSNVGLIYGTLTLISVISFVLALRWSNSSATRSRIAPRPAASPTITMHDSPALYSGEGVSR